MVFVDLTAAYDTVNHRGLLLKVSKILKNRTIVKVIRSLTENRKFYVEMALKAGGRCRIIAYHRVQSWHPCYSIYIPTTDPLHQMSVDLSMRMTYVWPLNPPPLKKLTQLSAALEQMGQYYDK